MPVDQAAERMATDTDTVLAQVHAGRLECQIVGTTLYVRPAIVTTLGVTRR